MDYEKKIREYMVSSKVDQLYKSMLINLFPELAESEDEKIRKEIINHLISFNNGCYKIPSKDIIDNWIAWLEKQKCPEPTLTKEHSEEVLSVEYGGKENNQKPVEWSEEDLSMIGRIRSIIEKYAFSQSAVDVNGELCEKEFIDADNWLKSLRPQKKQEHIEPSWLDEANNDEELLIAIEALEKAGQHDSALWVKHLADSYPQSHWKPSEEQMEALRVAKAYPSSERREILETLYEDLEQLKAL